MSQPVNESDFTDNFSTETYQDQAKLRNRFTKLYNQLLIDGAAWVKTQLDSQCDPNVQYAAYVDSLGEDPDPGPSLEGFLAYLDALTIEDYLGVNNEG